MKPKKWEQKQWLFARSSMPPTRNREGYCNECNKKLSKYNIGRYCFLHQHKQVAEDDEKMLLEVRKAQEQHKRRKHEKTKLGNKDDSV